MFEKFDSFTFFPAQHWSHAWERQHELVYRFARSIDREINIFPPLGLINYNVFSAEFIKKVCNKLKKQKSINNSQKTAENMNFINSYYIHRFDKLSTRINYSILNSKAKLGEKNFFWATYINPTNYLFFQQSSFKVIDLAERRQANPKLSNQMKELEKKAVSEADIVFVDNLATFEDYKHLNSNIKYVPQGYDATKILFEKEQDRELVGYVGHLHPHIDYEYLFRLIEMNPMLTFLIVGGVLDKTALQLKKYKNVIMTGQVSKDDLQQYLEKMKYGLIPYKVNEFTKGVFPTKLFEYLGAGVPVISTPIPEVLNYQNNNYVFIEEEAKEINYSVCLDGIEDFLIDNTWDSRFNQYLRYIGEELR
ncbi:glycosyltransferase [Bacillus sp. AS_5]|uniref:glycosyltransferase n=1 Tax=unclassified Bacillus (in: firmicutes) TaxID=185979 RepID=UPI001262AA35|nr:MULTISPECIES: glycosyltransferase [unclassified Bacillus (in: firmicutes)]KAB7679820.1 glycosyltransferase family 1 protein [Bacillus sp. B1-WWTP-T-0.5-Post-4]MCW4653465.1 glycosyltransferase [Bacillus sp. AS_3]MCX2702808.1 glycosyltransferase [Bacillus sp. AS_5]